MNGGTRIGECSATPVVGYPELLDQAQWYAVWTRSRHEKLVAGQLEKQGIESFLPIVTQTRSWSDRRKQVEMPLFPGYAFVRIVQSSSDRIRVLRTQGVVSFVGVQSAGTPIPVHQIESIKTLLASKIPFQEHPMLRIGQRVRIRGGALDGVEGVLSAANGDHSLVISVEAIERSLSISVAGYEVEAA